MENQYSPKKLKRYMLIMGLALFVVFGGLAAYGLIGRYFMGQYFANYKPPAVTISASKAKLSTWQPYITAIGQLVASDGVDVSSESSGLVVKIYFKSGQSVKKDTPLVQLDDRIDQQELKRLQAQLKLAKITYDRIKALYEKRATSRSSLDEAQAKLQEMEAMVDKTKVLVEQKTIKAYFSGIIGINKINVGQYITPNTEVANLQALDPIQASFWLPEQYLPKLYAGQPVKLRVDTQKNRIFDGKITAINSTVDPRTHNILVRAQFDNKQKLLYPGLFANLRILLPKKEKVVTIPQTAVTYSLHGHSVFVIKSKPNAKKGKQELIAYRTYVQTGDRRGSQVAITDGLKAGDLVVTSGQLKLQDKTPVKIDNTVNLNGSNGKLY